MNLYDLNRKHLTQLVESWGFRPIHADRIWKHLYSRLLPSIDYTDKHLPKDLLPKLQSEASLFSPLLEADAKSCDGFTRKFLLRLEDGETIETVLMRYSGRMTACVSSQVGCAMGCIFCATGQMGFTRHLSTGEIVTQVLHVDRALRDQGEKLRNIVFMGMGEPLHNYDSVMTAIDILCDQKGLSLAGKRISVSTVGHVPGIRRLTKEKRNISLAVSLHGATDEDRNALVPLGRRWPLAELMDACRQYAETLDRHIFFEWTLIDKKNDSPEQAHAVGKLLQKIPSHVNLIPLNPTQGYEGKPGNNAAAHAFQAVLAKYQIPCTIRQRRGIDVAAGCGQLKELKQKVVS
ncbi:MAG: 23S rRNA (adenine(2503)-C(2))-methyltransferase RlmN [Opitutaceae bacterium]|nr:23S rRNA (adenine(2503)-C(2))-methyltransferase RlmN [Opitutaceae bacterium]